MYRYTCKVCGKPMEARTYTEKRQFCSKDCRYEYAHNRKAYDVPIEPSERHYVHPKGFDNLLRAICRQARDDVMHYPPDHYLRIDAERFFMSDYFAVLTELDGQAILRNLAKSYNRRTKKDGHGN